MRRINLFFDNSFYTFSWLQPLFEAKKYLKELGFDLCFSRFCILNTFFRKNHLPTIRNQKYDLVFLAFHHKSVLGKMSISDRTDFLQKLRLHANKIVWLDCADSTGTCMFDVLPYVDLYLKKQILKNKELYLKHFFGQRVYTDYYCRNFFLDSIDDETEMDYVGNKALLNKIDISWNIALWNNIVGGKGHKIKKFLSIDTIKKEKKSVPFKNRSTLLFFNGSCPNKTTPISFQRIKLFELVGKYDSDLFVANPNLLPKKEYLERMKNTLYTPSPFGWGEICNRDFEAFLYGSCLVKPSVEHIDTFPNIFIPNETYIPIKWDFSDFKLKIDYLVSEKGKLVGDSISKNSHDLFFKIRFGKGKLLADHIVDILKKHNV